MAKPKHDNVSSAPLFEWFKLDKGRRAAFRRSGYSDGRITNWKSRGIPRAEIGPIAAHMGLTYEEYLAAAGAPVEGSYGLRLQLEEAEAVKRLRGALPDWRRYVLGLAMIDNKETQGLLLTTMREAVPDKRVEQFVTVAPHAGKRREPLFSVEERNISRAPDAKKKRRLSE